MLKKEHIKSLNAAMALLRSLEEETLTEVRYPYGKFGEACRNAELALSNVLLIAKHWLKDEDNDDEEDRR